MNQITLLFDFDDVLFPLVPHWVNELNATYGTNVLASEIIDWDIAKFFPTLSKRQVFEPIEREQFWLQMKPVEGGVNALKKLYDLGYKIKVVTATSYLNVKPKAIILLQHYSFLSWNDVHVTVDKKSVTGCVLVDDKPENLVGGSYVKILMNAPHNMFFDEGDDIYRVNNLEQACDLIIKLFPIDNGQIECGEQLKFNLD